MGLLDSVIGGVLNSALGQGNHSAGTGGLNSGLLAALLPIALSMLHGQSASTTANSGGMGGGGLGDVLGGVLGGGGGSGLGSVLGSVLSGGSNAAAGGLGNLGGLGGLGDLLNQFQKAGFGDHAASWIGTGENKPLPPDAIGQVLGGNMLSNIAQQAGISEADASSGLGQLLPQLIDHLTPGGQMPAPDQLAKGLEALGLRLG